jgi:hypothetical protein
MWPALAAVNAQQPGATAPAADAISDLAELWDGGARARPVNSDSIPWVKGKSFPN